MDLHGRHIISSKRANYLLQFTVGSLRATTRAI
jgi:hypothetical protein